MELFISLFTSLIKFSDTLLTFALGFVLIGIAFGIFHFTETYIHWLKKQSSLKRWLLYIPCNILICLLLNISIYFASASALEIFLRDAVNLHEFAYQILPFIQQAIAFPTFLYIVWKTSPRAATFQVLAATVPPIVVSILALTWFFESLKRGTTNGSDISNTLLGAFLILNSIIAIRYYLKYPEEQREDHPLNFIRWAFGYGDTKKSIKVSEHKVQVFH